MSKKGISKNQKEIQQRIVTALHNGTSKQKILDELSEEYFDKTTLAKMIIATPDDATKAKYKTLNNAKTGRLYVISAASGTGKTRLIKGLLTHVDNLMMSISYTTVSHTPFQNRKYPPEYLFRASYSPII